MEKVPLLSLKQLKPEFDTKKVEFICLFTGRSTKQAYLINRTYGSFLDPVLAMTWLEREKGKTLTCDFYNQLRAMVSKDTGVENPLTLTLLENASIQTMNNLHTHHYKELDKHINYMRKTKPYQHLETDATVYIEKTKKKPRPKSCETQKIVHLYQFTQQDMLTEHTEINTNQIYSLENICEGLMVSIHNIKPSSFLIAFSNSKNDEMNIPVNSALGKFSMPQNHKGDVIIISKIPLCPDVEKKPPVDDKS